MLTRTGRPLRALIAASGWRELYVLVRHTPDGSPLRRALVECGHSEAEHLGLMQHHAARVSNWQRAGGKQSTYPRLPECLDPDTKKTTYGGRGDALPLPDMADWLGWQLPVVLN